MTKVRRPGTIEAALWQAKDILGIEELADICGKSVSMITRYLDIDDETRNLPAKYIVAIDAACMKAAGEAPLTSHLTRRLDAIEPERGCMKNAALAIAREAGKICDIVEKATSPTGPGGTGWTFNEAHKGLEALDDLDRKTERARSRLKRYTRTNLKEVG